MAKGNTYRCAACGAEYKFCPRCAVTPPSYDAEHFCSRRHAEIFEILSKHGCHLATAEETLETLGDIDIDEFTPSIQDHIIALEAEVENHKEENDER